MNKYVVGYLSLHVGELVQEIVLTTSKLKAANIYLQSDFESMDEVYDMMANSDSYISVLEVL